METEWWLELETQIEDHGPEKVIFWMQTDDGEGQIMITDIIYEDDQIKVKLA